MVGAGNRQRKFGQPMRFVALHRSAYGFCFFEREADGAPVGPQPFGLTNGRLASPSSLP